MSKLRPIRTMRELIPGELPSLDLGQTPILRWAPPESLLVDDAYQRDLGDRSRRLIRKLVTNFAWRKMKPPIVVEVEGGLHCVDGQHTAIAAATLKIPEIPVFIIGAATLIERAEAFVAHNKDRIVMTPMDVYRARLAAGDPDALDVRNVCERAGVTLKLINPQSKVMIGDCASVSKISALVKRQGPQKARMVLEALVAGGRAPIGSAEIEAVEAAMVLVRPATTIAEMAGAIRAVSDHGVVEAKMEAALDGKPHKHMLFQAYMKVLEKQTGVVRALAS
jgi:hypothetical protein